ncbi:hypothetical protein BGZ74_000634 [Mortierella antarctica]|nr:hypothetical protein BGZ74_000634 [Mortierella antarctica]
MENEYSTNEEVAELKQLFAAHDKNQDGRLSTDELLKLIQSVGEKADETEIRCAIESFDTDSDGSLDENEFLRLMSALRSMD